MLKLKLAMEDLRVESFETTSTAREKGTVFGEQCTCYTQCTCPGCATCDATCPQTCGETCPFTCDDISCAGSCNDPLTETRGDGTCTISWYGYYSCIC